MKGNSFWRLRAVSGPLPKYADPAHLWQVFQEYMADVLDNPLYEEKLFHYKGNVTRHEIAKARAPTVGGFCGYAGIIPNTFYRYGEREDMRDTVAAIKTAMTSAKIEGAAADLFNASIISREVGLKDHVDVTSEDGSMSPAGMGAFYGEVDTDDE